MIRSADTPVVPRSRRSRSSRCESFSSVWSGCNVAWTCDCKRCSRTFFSLRTRIGRDGLGYLPSRTTSCNVDTSTCRWCSLFYRTRSAGDGSGWRCGCNPCRNSSTCKACPSPGTTRTILEREAEDPVNILSQVDRTVRRWWPRCSRSSTVADTSGTHGNPACCVYRNVTQDQHLRHESTLIRRREGKNNMYMSTLSC